MRSDFYMLYIEHLINNMVSMVRVIARQQHQDSGTTGNEKYDFWTLLWDVPIY